MNTAWANTLQRPLSSDAPPGPLQRLCGRGVLRILARARRGRLRLVLPDGTERLLGGSEPGPEAELLVRRHAFFASAAFGGDVGFGESYTRGDWDAPDPAATLRFLISNGDRLASRWDPAWLMGRANRLLHLSRRNTLGGSRRNIAAHYDLGDAFFRLFLDPTMTYSCALYREGASDLEAAQRAKLGAVMRRARLRACDHVLEIGCGWGSFAVAAARETGCRVTGLTISERQFEAARRRVQEEGLGERVAIRLCDYRKVAGRFDKIVSIEMLEAVGHEYLPGFFAACDRLLKPGGLLALQVITVSDQRYEAYRRGCDWIQKHIFPGAVVPSVTAVVSAATAGSSLVLEEYDAIGLDYVPTLRAWRRALRERWEDAKALGFDEESLRRWEYYFCYSEAGFATRWLGDAHLVFGRPEPRPGESPP